MSSFVGADNLTQPNEPVTAFHVAKRKEFLCTRCGTKHLPKSCPAYKKDCNKCGKSGYFAKVCRNKRFQNKSKHVGFERQSHSIDIFSVDTFEKSGITKEIKVCGKIASYSNIAKFRRQKLLKESYMQVSQGAYCSHTTPGSKNARA